jgi:hypothetical protein
MTKFARVDILGGDRMKCVDCSNPFGTRFAVRGGICTDPLCFKCIMKYCDEQNLVIA